MKKETSTREETIRFKHRGAVVNKIINGTYLCRTMDEYKKSSLRACPINKKAGSYRRVQFVGHHSFLRRI